jgi:ABC-type transport system involved in multi-copper enzyme maturation permease subunit
MFSKKIAVIIMLASLLLMPILQVLLASPFEAVAIDTAYARALSGRNLDIELFMDASHAYGTESERAYNDVIWIMGQIFDTLPITEEQANDFYYLRREQLAEIMYRHYERGHIGLQSVEQILQLDERNNTPWVFEYAGGYHMFLQGQIVVIVVAFLIAVFVSPIFAGEHSTGVSQLILTSRHGKGKLVWAKIFTAVSFSIVVSLVYIAINYLTYMVIYGTDGANAPFQLFMPHSPYSLTLGEASIIFVVNILLRLLFFGAVLLFLSAKFKSAFGVMAFATAWLFASTFIWLDILLQVELLHVISRPTINAIPFVVTTFANFPYEIFGIVILPFVFEPIFAVVASIIILPFAGRAFKHHQMG